MNSWRPNVPAISFKMSTFLALVDSSVLYCFAILIFRVKSEIYIDGSKSLKRHTKNGFSYANFETNKFFYLNITPLGSASVKGFLNAVYFVSHIPRVSLLILRRFVRKEKFCVNCYQAINTTAQTS